MKKSRPLSAEVERYTPTLQAGLSAEQVAIRLKQGLDNEVHDHVEKSYFQIVCGNIFTIFNFAFFVIALGFLIYDIVLRSTGHADDANHWFGISKFGFLGPAIVNTIIATVQEINSKKTLKKLRIINEAKSEVIRDGKSILVPGEELVLDDVIFLSAGQQVLADCLLQEGELNVDESLLTGESELVRKVKGDQLYSGSSILIGKGKGRVIRVGDETYASELTRKVKSLARHKSELMNHIKGIIRAMSIVLFIVVGVVIGTLVYKILRWGGDPAVFPKELSLTNPAYIPGTWAAIIVTAGAFAIGVIPEGLVLVTSIALTASIVKLAREQTLVQELYSLENLSRVDTICLDKTGTLTDGSMRVIETKAFIAEEEVRRRLRVLLGAGDADNATSLALKSAFGQEEDNEVAELLPFSSAKKSSGIRYRNGDVLILGAPEYLLPLGDVRLAFASARSQEGGRVLALTLNGELLAFFVLEDNIRLAAKETIAFFYENGVDVKIISGDNPLTVAKIAEVCGVRGTDKVISLDGVAEADIPALVEEYTIFARVSPEQKQSLVEALQDKGRKVAMTGDGVNDILALRKSNASITFATATDAAKSCSDVVLMDNDFSHLKEVVGQGRRVVNNTERTAVLFLMKTLAILLICLSLVPFKMGQMWYSIENIYLLQATSIGVGGFFLSLEGRKTPIQGSFLKNVFSKVVPSGILIWLGAMLPLFLYSIPRWFGGAEIISYQNTRSLISILTTLAGLVVMITMCMPYTKYRAKVLAIVLAAALALAFGLPTSYVGGLPTGVSMFASPDGNFLHSQLMREFFQPWNVAIFHELLEWRVFLIMGCFLLFAFPLFYFLMKYFQKQAVTAGFEKAFSPFIEKEKNGN